METLTLCTEYTVPIRGAIQYVQDIPRSIYSKAERHYGRGRNGSGGMRGRHQIG
jgi:hypothetical protein